MVVEILTVVYITEVRIDASNESAEAEPVPVLALTSFMGVYVLHSRLTPSLSKYPTHNNRNILEVSGLITHNIFPTVSMQA